MMHNPTTVLESVPQSDTVALPFQTATSVETKKKQKESVSPAGGRRRRSDPHRRLTAWVVIVWLVVLHGGALAAPFTFSWEGVALMAVLHWVTGGLGVCLGYHRLLTHSSFQTYAPVRWFFAFIGGLSGEGSAIDWVANHRKHHAHSDQEGDPHSPLDGAWWSHMLWLGLTYPAAEHRKHNQRWAPDLSRDAVLRFLGHTFIVWHFVMGGVLFGLGYAWGGTSMAWSFLVWGMFVRLCGVLHATWFVNSASHMWGYRNYTTTDQSRNNWWVALITYGEGWHNNHHAFPRMAAHGHRWWEIDVTFLTIRLMQRIGLAWDVVDYKRGSEKLGPARRKSA